jgi:hypothetical protein
MYSLHIKRFTNGFGKFNPKEHDFTVEAHHDGKKVGFALIAHRPHGLMVSNTEVDKAHQGKGAGKLMLKEAFKKSGNKQILKSPDMTDAGRALYNSLKISNPEMIAHHLGKSEFTIQNNDLYVTGAEMKKSADEITQDIIDDIKFQDLTKGMPPKLKYRLTAWLKRFSSKLQNPTEVKKFEQTVKKEIESMHKLEKHEARVDMYRSGAIKMEFGADVPEDVKKAALKWAERKGLKQVEVSLAKSKNATSHVIFAESKNYSLGDIAVTTYLNRKE